jgi:hypothetical protein
MGRTRRKRGVKTMVNKKKIYKGMLGLLAVLIALSVINATQFARVGAAYGYSVGVQGAYIQFMACDRVANKSTATPVLTSDGVDFAIDLGTWAGRTNKTYTAAFALVNCEVYSVRLYSVNVTNPTVSTDADNIYIWVHARRTSLCSYAQHNIPSTDSRVDTDKVLMWDGANGHPFGNSWTLAAGYGYGATAACQYDNDTTDGIGPDDATFSGFNVWTWDSTPLGSNDALDSAGSTANANFVWVEITIVVPEGESSGSHGGIIQFQFESVGETGV